MEALGRSLWCEWVYLWRVPGYAVRSICWRSSIRGKSNRGHESAARRWVASDKFFTVTVWCSGCNLNDDWFASNHEYLAKDVAFEVRLRRRSSKRRKFFVRWHNVEVIGIRSQSRGEIFVPVPLSRIGEPITRPVVCYTVFFAYIRVLQWYSQSIFRRCRPGLIGTV